MIYWNLGQSAKKYSLLVFNLFFIFCYGFSPLIIVLFSATISYALLRQKYFMLLVYFNLLFLISFKFIVPHTPLIVTVGLSYYTLNLISYALDIKRGILTPHLNFLDHLLYVTFSPIFLSGPLNRAKNFFQDLQEIKLPDEKKVITLFFMFLWGYFKKSYCGDWLNIHYTSVVFHNLGHYHSLTILSAVFFYVLEIYFDFSGYSLMARSAAGFLGFDIPHNFNYPFLSKSVTEFWNRWHMTLSLWLRDYIYYPLRLKMQKMSPVPVIIISTMTTWIVAGVWHGKGWMFFYYGIIQGIYLTIHQLWKFHENNRLKRLNIKRITKHSPLRNLVSIIFTFLLFSFSMILFRSSSIDEYFNICRALIHQFNSSVTNLFPTHLLVFALVFLGEHLWGEKSWTEKWEIQNAWTKGAIAGIMILYLFLVAPKNFIQFIYFNY